MVGKKEKGKEFEKKRYKPNRQRHSEKVLLQREVGGSSPYSKLFKKTTLNSFFFHIFKGLNKRTILGSERHQLVAPAAAAVSH